ncbi:MAG TPA: hypothetical protein V6D21_05910 [Candidatus Obscuribacterales bacterium]
MAVDLSNESLWHEIVNYSVNKTTGDIDYRFPLFYLNRYARAIVTTGLSANLYAGKISLMIGSINAETPVFSNQINVFFNKMRLLDFPLISSASSSQFHIVYTPPYWVKELNIKVWQYEDL